MGRTSHAVFPEQGHYANDSEVLASYPPVENQLDQVSDLLNYLRHGRATPLASSINDRAITKGRYLVHKPDKGFRRRNRRACCGFHYYEKGCMWSL